MGISSSASKGELHIYTVYRSLRERGHRQKQGTTLLIPSFFRVGNFQAKFHSIQNTYPEKDPTLYRQKIDAFKFKSLILSKLKKNDLSKFPFTFVPSGVYICEVFQNLPQTLCLYLSKNWLVENRLKQINKDNVISSVLD